MSDIVLTPETAPAGLPPAVEDPKPKPTILANADLDASPNTETDKHVTDTLERKKQKKHPVEARIGELTAKAKELEETLKKEREEREAAASVAIPKPALADFNTFEAYSEALAVWAARRNGGAVAPKDAGTAAAPAAKIESTPAPATSAPSFAPEFVAMRKEEFDGFLESGRQFLARTPDFIDTMEQAEKRGLNFSVGARVTMAKQGAGGVQVAYHLARPENDSEARRFMQMNDFDQALEVVRIAERLRAKPSDFVSSTPAPGRRLHGGAITDVRPEEMSTDDYLRRRAEQFRTGERRRRR